MLFRPSFVSMVTVSLAALTITFANAARADGPADPWSKRPVALHAIAALPGGPVGVLGLELDYAAASSFGIHAAVGLGLSDTPDGTTTTRPRASAGARYRLKLDDGYAVSLGPTVSVGRSFRSEFQFDDQDGGKSVIDVPVAVWLGGQLAFEFRWSSGVSLKALVGLERMINRGSDDCYVVSTSSSRAPVRGTRLGNVSCESVQVLGFDPWFPSTGIAVGYAF